MAYDAATGTVVLFGGERQLGTLGDTWTWDGTTWTKQAPGDQPARPDRRVDGLRRGHRHRGAVRRRRARQEGLLDDTWTWDGTTWTEQTPATSPPARTDAVDGLRRGHRHRGAVRRHRPHVATSVTPGPGWLRLAPPEPVPRPCQADGQLTRRSFRYRELQDLRPCPACRWRLRRVMWVDHGVSS